MRSILPSLRRKPPTGIGPQLRMDPFQRRPPRFPPGSLRRADMYGTFSGMSFGLVAFVALLVIALAVLASPLLAVIILGVAAIFLVIGMSALRQRSARQDRTEGGATDTRSPGPRSGGGGAPPSRDGH